MAAVRSAGTRSTELRIRGALVRAGLRGWSVNASDVLGRPDFLFRKQLVAVFLDGCFWHGCSTCGHIPKMNYAFWMAKIAANKKRDRLVSKKLRAAGYVVIRFWEHEVREDLNRCLRTIRKHLR